MSNLWAQFSEDQIRSIAERHPQASPEIRRQWLENIKRRIMDSDYRTSRNEVGSL